MSPSPITVGILFNQTGDDEYERLRGVDPQSLDFKPEYRIDVATAMEEYEALASALEREGFRVRLLNIEDDLSRMLDLLRRRRVDVVFNLVEHFQEESGLEASVAGVLELLNIPFTGAPAFSLTLCQRKGLTKQVLLANGVPTPHYRLLYTPHLPERHGLRYPVIVKPGREDASAGIHPHSVARSWKSLRKAVTAAFKEFRPPILVEEYIDGRELHVSILGNDPPTTLPVLEYDFNELPRRHPKILSFATKWDPLKEEYHRIHAVCPAPLPQATARAVRDLAVRSFDLTGCRDYARVDMRLSPTRGIYVLEVNPNPDLTEGVSFMDCAEKAGLTFSETLHRIVEMALARRVSRPLPKPEGAGPR